MIMHENVLVMTNQKQLMTKRKRSKFQHSVNKKLSV